jgi:hypothetical protein
VDTVSLMSWIEPIVCLDACGATSDSHSRFSSLLLLSFTSIDYTSLLAVCLRNYIKNEADLGDLAGVGESSGITGSLNESLLCILLGKESMDV